MLSALLKHSTETAHARLENLMYVDDIYHKKITLPQYTQLILINFIVHAEIEKNIHQALNNTVATIALRDVDTRQKLEALRADLEELRLVPEQYTLPAKPKFTNQQEALGGMYVLEGATLGGNVIAKHLKDIPQLQNFSFHFYTVYKDNIGPKWKTFVEFMDSHLFNEDQKKMVIKKALATFKYFAQVATMVKKQ